MRHSEFHPLDVPEDLLKAHFGAKRTATLRAQGEPVTLPVAVLYPPGDTCDDEDRSPEDHLAELLMRERATLQAELNHAPGAIPVEPAINVARAFLRSLADKGLVFVRAEPEEAEYNGF